jgi:hypothetical protein
VNPPPPDELAALVDAGPTRSFPLSGRFTDHAGPAKYTSSASKQPCDECIALQHATAGRSGTRAPVRYARTRSGQRLLLCGPHREQWVELDEAA